MPKLKLALILPVLHFSIACPLLLCEFKFADRLPVSTFLYRPEIARLYHGMNAPAWLVGGLIAEGIQLLTSVAVPSRPAWSSPSVYGIPLREVLLLFLVVPLWWIVGRALDEHKLPRMATRGMKLWGILVDVFLFLLGVVLVFDAIHEINGVQSTASVFGGKYFLYFRFPPLPRSWRGHHS